MANNDSQNRVVKPLAAYRTLIGAMMIHLMIGNLNLWGSIANYVISYYY